MSDIITPKTQPNDHFVGHHFVGPCFRCDAGKHVYYCDSYDRRIGFWLTRADCLPEHIADTEGEWRRNVSERAIGRTYHLIHDDGSDGCWSAWGRIDRALLLVPIP